MPTVLEHYVDPQAGRSYTSLSRVPAEDLNEVWKIIPYEQLNSVLQQVAEHIDIIAQLKKDRIKVGALSSYIAQLTPLA